MSNFSKPVISLILFFVVIVLAFLFWKQSSISSKFVGSVQRVKDSSIVVHGKFDTGEKDRISLSDTEILVSENTKFVKTSFVRPPGGGMFIAADLPKEVADVDFQVLKNDSKNVVIGIEIYLKRNFYGKVLMEAKEVRYIAPKY